MTDQYLDSAFPNHWGLNLEPWTPEIYLQPSILIVSWDRVPPGLDLSLLHSAWNYMSAPLGLATIATLTLLHPVIYELSGSFHLFQFLGNALKFSVCRFYISVWQKWSWVERWLSSYRRLLLLHKFLASVFWLTTTCNSNFKTSDALFWPPQALHACDIHTFKLNECWSILFLLYFYEWNFFLGFIFSTY